MNDEAPDPIFEALWKAVLDKWDDDAPHAALLEYALRSEHLPTAAARYRALENDPQKSARAQKRLDAIVVAATQLMMTMKTPSAVTKAPRILTAAAFVVAVFLLVYVAYAMLGRR